MTRLLALVSLLALAGTAPAQFVWNAQTGNWDVPANWVGNAVPPSDPATQLVFNNTGAGYTATNNIGPFTLNRLTVNNTGTGPVTVASSAAANSLTFAGTTPTVDVQAGTLVLTSVLAGPVTFTKTGPGTLIQSSNSNGFDGSTIIIDQGTFATENLSGTHNLDAAAIIVNNGGTFRFGNNLAGDPNLPNATYITVNPGGAVSWQEGEVFGGFNLQGGTIDLALGGATTSGGTAQSWTAGTITGGSFAAGGSAPVNKTTTGTVTVGGGVTLTSALNIQAGTIVFLNPANVPGSTAVLLGDAAASTGTYSYQGAGDATRAGAFTVDAGGGVIEVTNPSSTLTVVNAVGGTGPLAKTGNGILALAATPTTTGTTTVSAGTLRVTPGTASGGFAVAGAGTLAVSAGTGAASFSVPTLALTGVGAPSVVAFELNATGLPTVPALTITNTDGLTGGGTLRLTNLQAFANGTYPLIDYTGAAVTSGFTLQLPGRTAGTLVYNTAATRLDASITGTDTIRWGGQASNVWDVGTAANVGGALNWRLVSTGTGTNFIQTDTVTFDDTGANPAVDITAAVAPAVVAVNNASVQYTFGGAGRITGPAGLTKSGTGSLVLATDNDYTGGTTVDGGLLQFGAGGTTGSVTGPIALADNTTLAFNRSAAATFGNTLSAAGSLGLRQNGAGAITLSAPITSGAGTLTVDGPGDLLLGGVLTGTGTLTKTGAGTLTLLADNDPFTGAVNVNAGTLVLDDRGALGDLGAATITVASGATFQFGNADQTGNPDLPGTTRIVLQAGGTAVWNIAEDYGRLDLQGGTLRIQATATNSGNNNLTDTANGPNQWTSGSVTNIGSPTVATGIGSAGAVVKTTSGTVTFNAVNLNLTGLIDIQEGAIETNAGIGGTAANGAISFGTAATAGTLRLTNPDTAVVTTVARPLVVNAGGGTIDVTTAGKIYAFTGSATGTGLLTKTGPGVLAVSGTTAGPVSVVAGSLRPGTGLAAATFGVGDTLNLAAGSALRVNLFGTGDADNGRVNVTGTATIASGALLQLDASALSQADVDAIRAGGSRTYTVLQAGSLPANFTGLDQAGSSYGLFSSTEFSLQLSPGANTVQISFTPVPEPATVLAVCAVALGVGRRLRRAAFGEKPVVGAESWFRHYTNRVFG